jgi:AcrR family transcriptional regulator
LTKKNDRSTVRNMNDMANNETREIILDVTEKLIYRHGIAATGMDLLVKTAGVSRKSIYRYFANKDELVIAALQRRDARWLLWLRSEVEQYAGSGARLLGVFSALKAWFGSADFRGCAFINTSGETGNPQDPVRLLAKAHKQKLFEYLLELCKAHGTPAPEKQAAQLLILVDGAITIALIMGDVTAADNAQCMAQDLLAL